MPEHPVIDRYEILRGLGRGAMGSVYLALDPKMGREVAIKVLQREFAQSHKHRQRFEREARAIAALKHPNIVDIYDYGGSPDDHLYLVMQYIKGPHTGALCREHGVFPESVLACLGMELAEALRVAHAAGIIHRDLKPENVFFDAGRVVLADFGIAKAIAEENPFGADAASPYTEVIGTPGFMAPEQLEQQPLEARTDIFSFGALLYYLGSRKLPFDADSPYELLKAFRESRPIPLNDLRPEISEQMSRLLQDCLEVEPTARPGTMEEIYRRLRDCLERLGAREPREILESYERDPMTFRADDRHRVVQHLIGRLKISVRDQDGITADEIRGRLAVLDPDNVEATHISGVRQLLKHRRGDTEPEVALARHNRRGWIWAAAVFAAVLIGATLLATSDFSLSTLTPTAAEPTPEVAMLMVRANDRTAVFVDGRALGNTPDFPPAVIPAGTVSLELVQDKRGKLSQKLELAGGDNVTVVVDWRRKKVRVKKTRKSEAPAP
jgi:serine/threonine protein kinase